MRRVVQILPCFTDGDAISDFARLLHGIFASLELDSKIYSPLIEPQVAGYCRPLRQLPADFSPSDQILYHYSTISEATDVFLSLSARRVVIFHNITEPELLAPFNAAAAAQARASLQQLARLKGKIEGLIAVSEFNKSTLISLGFDDVHILPLTIDPGRLATSPNEELMVSYSRDLTTFLFVGRVFPHKRIEDVIQIFSYFQRFLEPKSRLFIVGDVKQMPQYFHYLNNTIEVKKLKNVVFTGKVPLSHLIAYYNLADIFLTMSEHEGFCLPLLEAMHFQVPIIAYACPGVAETLSDAGVRVKKKNFPEIAELIHLITTDAKFRAGIANGQQERLKCFAVENFKHRLKMVLKTLEVPI